jgi:hypothetical protein
MPRRPDVDSSAGVRATGNTKINCYLEAIGNYYCCYTAPCAHALLLKAHFPDVYIQPNKSRLREMMSRVLILMGVVDLFPTKYTSFSQQFIYQ